MVIDCDTCVMRDLACADCVVTFLAPAARSGSAPEEGPPPDLSDSESRALAVLAGSGLVPPLRLANPASSRAG